MPGNQGQGQQELVFGQLQQIQGLGQHQNIGVIALGVPGFGLFLGGRKQEVTTQVQGNRHRLQAALAGALHHGVRLQVQPQFRLPAPHGPTFGGSGPVQHLIDRGRPLTWVSQAFQSCQGPLSVDRLGAIGQGRHIQAFGVQGSASRGCGHGRVSVALRDNLQMTAPHLILASTSRYRRELLQRLQLPFDALAPGVDETPLPGEAPAALAQRLALAKAQAVAARHPQAVVIGSDQVADLDGLAIGKPHTHERAVEQLRSMSGRSVVFQTAVAVVRQDAGVAEVRLSPVVVRFRELQDDEIETYLRCEKPYDCAGSAKSEGLGITLLDRVESSDPTALIGLPLTTVCELMRLAGLDPLTGGMR